jgi:GNAT superfamily N-acetyltransferase
MVELRIAAIDPLDQTAVDQWLAVQQAAQDADGLDLPKVSAASRIGRLLRTTSARRTEYWLAWQEGRVVGGVEAMFFLRDNQHLAEVELYVAPDRRRQGIGTALLEHVEKRVAAEDRDTIIAYAVDPIDGGSPRPLDGQRFAEAAGYSRGLDEIHRVADLSAVAGADLDRLLAEAWHRAEGYELVQWAGSEPDDIVAGAAYLNSRMNLDSPMGDLDVEQQDLDAAQVREREAVSLASGELELGTAVRHAATGNVAGFTAIHVLAGDETHCFQGNTIVDPEHRGRRLGTILKVENHRLLRSYRPRMRFVHTWNAEENGHMISINEAVGYRASDRWIAYQKRLAAGR